MPFSPGASKKRDRNLYIHPLFQILQKSLPDAKIAILRLVKNKKP
jgi:hypothetical protein